MDTSIFAILLCSGLIWAMFWSVKLTTIGIQNLRFASLTLIKRSKTRFEWQTRDSEMRARKPFQWTKSRMKTFMRTDFEWLESKN